MDLKALIKNTISKQLADNYQINFDAEDILVERPANLEWGDYATNIALKLTKELGQPTKDIANKVAYGASLALVSGSGDVSDLQPFSEIYAAPNGFINFRISPLWLNKLLNQISALNKDYGSSSIGAKESLVVEFSQANSNKPLHIGHARNNFIGSSLSNIYEFLGFDVTKANYIGDIGIHICKSMLMYKKYADNQTPDKKPDHYIGDFYIRFEQESVNNKELISEAQELLRRWEAKDPEVLALWEKLNSWVYEGWEETFKDQNVEFDSLEYESNCIDVGKEIVDIAVSKGVAVKDSTGAIIAKLEQYDLPDKVLLRSDGTSLYSTKDLQLALDSWNKYHFKKRLYVVDSRQSDYFKQIFKILEVLGFDWAERLIHVQYGFVTLPEGKMSSRTGVVVNADDVFNKIEELELAEVSKSLKEIDNKEDVARKVALAAFRYGILKVDPKQDLVFDYALVTRFDGNTGPYLMYSYARSQSILAKLTVEERELLVDLKPYALIDNVESGLMRVLYRFPEVVLEAGDKRAPNLVCNYLYEVAQAFNGFYSDHSIMNAENNDQKYFRASLTQSVGIVLRNGLELLGIPVVERM